MCTVICQQYHTFLAAPETDLRRPTTGLGGALSLFCESPLRMTPESGLALLKLLKADISQTAVPDCRARAAGGEVLAATAGQSGAAASTDVPRMDVVERYARASVAARQNSELSSLCTKMHCSGFLPSVSAILLEACLPFKLGFTGSPSNNAQMFDPFIARPPSRYYATCKTTPTFQQGGSQ